MTGSLHVSVPTLPEDLSVDVDVLAAGDLAFETHLQAGETVPVRPGTYVIAATMPDGTQRTATRSVEANRRASVVFEWSPPSFERLSARAGARSASGPPPERVGVRFVTLGPEGLVAAECPPQAVVADLHVGDTVLQVAMDLELQDDWEGLRFAQLALPGRIPVSVALPLAPQSDASSCRLSVSVSSKNVDPAVRLGGDPSAGLIADYVVGGKPERIAAVRDLAQRMLLGKRRHPLAAALGGYALLSLGEIEGMRNWPANLAAWYEWLPDGAVITGELAARRGEHEAALATMADAVRRGPPVFTDGLSIITSRLRWSVRQPALARAAEELLRQVQVWAAYADLSSLCLTVVGGDVADLEGSQQPVDPQAGTDGWKIFRAPFGVPGGPDDYWEAEA